MGEDYINGQTERYSLMCFDFLIDWTIFHFLDFFANILVKSMFYGTNGQDTHSH